MHILNRQTSKDPDIMVLVREIILKALILYVVFQSEYIPGIENTLADPLS